MSDKFRISLPGSDVFNARLADEVIDSLYPNPKVNTLANPPHAGIIFLNWASTNIIVPNTQTKLLYSFAHNYNYIPTVIAVYTFSNGSQTGSGLLPCQPTADIGIVDIDADLTNINLKWYSLDVSNVTPVSPFTMKIRFYVFAELGF